MKSPIHEVGEQEEVKDCQLLKVFSGQAGEFIFGTPYMGNFKNEAIAEAEKIGATHVMYRAELDGGIEYSNVVYAYKCPQNHETLRNGEEY